jgi:hypothetical protein
MHSCLEDVRRLTARRYRRALAGLVVGATAGAFVGLVAVPAQAASIANFGQYAPGTFTWTVPDGVNAAVFDLYGGTGGGGAAGGHVQAALSVIPGEVYTLVVGGKGAVPHGLSDIDGGAGGFNGGGAGADGNGLGYAGYGGGGGSDVRFNGNRILVAGGAGGAGFATIGGAGGSDVGATAPPDATHTTPATGGTQTEGGTGASDVNHYHGEDGAAGVGGSGGSAPNGGGGGGGGGWYGGGGGVGAGGGGGGSNFVTVNAFDPVSERGVAAPVANGGEGAIVVQYGVVDTPTFTADSPPAGTVGTAYSYTFAATGWPQPELRLSGALPDGLTFDSGSGTLSGTPSVAGTFALTLQALTPVGTYDDPVSLVITPPAQTAPTISGDPPGGTIGTAYAFDYTMTGEPAPTASVTSGDLPPGLGLSDSGHLSGTPTEAGTWSFTVTATNTAGTDSVDSTITIAPATPAQTAPTISGDPPGGTVGTAYAFDYTVTGEPAPTASVTSGDLPPGLGLSDSGHLSGTPTEAGTWSFTVTATNTAGTDSVDSTITIAASVPGAPTIGTATPGDGSATITFTPPSSNGGSEITGYTATATPVGGGTPVSAGGSGSPLTISGLTNGTTYTVTVAATNAVGTGPDSAPSNPVTPQAAVAPLQITTTSPLPPGTVGQPYSLTLTAAGGVGPYTWSLARGSRLPAGLTLRSDGTITGTPTRSCSRTFTVRVADSEASPQTDATSLRLSVGTAPKPDLAVSLVAVTTFRHGSVAAYRITVTNTGTGPTTSRPTVNVLLGRGQTATAWAASGWTCRHTGRHCVYDGVLAPGQSASYLLGVKVSAGRGARVSAAACVAPSDSTPRDNRSGTTVTVRR